MALAIIKEEPKESKPSDISQSDIFKQAENFLYRADKAPLIKSVKNRTARYRKLCNHILKNEDFKGDKLSALNSSYRLIMPKPNRLNSNKDIYRLHDTMRKLFKANLNLKLKKK